MNNLKYTRSYPLYLRGAWRHSKNNSIFFKKLKSQDSCLIFLAYSQKHSEFSHDSTVGQYSNKSRYIFVLPLIL